MFAFHPLSRATLAVLLATGLAACESSSRLGSLLPGDRYGPGPRANPPAAPAPLTPAPSEDEVESSALPPPPGSAATETLPAPTAPAPGGVATAPGAPLGGQGQPPAPGSLPAPRVATAPAAPSPAPTRTGVIGNWGVAEAAGNRCRITLSSAPKLDLYAAGTSGCQSKELQRVNAWELAGSEVILYEPGGGVVARLRQSGGQSFSGALAKTGAPVSISK